jgi:hypothetical protein
MFISRITLSGFRQSTIKNRQHVTCRLNSSHSFQPAPSNINHKRLAKILLDVNAQQGMTLYSFKDALRELNIVLVWDQHNIVIRSFYFTKKAKIKSLIPGESCVSLSTTLPAEAIRKLIFGLEQTL